MWKSLPGREYKDEDNKICDDESNDSNDDINNFSRLKEDFILLYSDNYVNNVQEDLLKLEIDLFVSKFLSLISFKLFLFLFNIRHFLL